MKTKKLDKKFTLNKNTVAHLGGTEMNEANGGTGLPYSILPTCLCTETCSCVISLCDTCS
ncbi:MAG: hypothetical protein GY940_00890 [bacterium]|nr:hypothetical protein [bacterium]